MRSNSCWRIHLLGIAHPIVGKYFRVLEVHRGMKYIQDVSCEEKAILALFFILKILGRKPNFCICKKKRVVIKLILND